MTEQEQIEEMAKLMCIDTSNRGECEKCSFTPHKVFGFTYQCSKYDNAEAIYNAGYRKLPEDSVVLSKEAYEKLKGRAEEVFNEMTERMKAEVKIAKRIGVVKGSKETAEKILNYLELSGIDTANCNRLSIFKSWII